MLSPYLNRARVVSQALSTIARSLSCIYSKQKKHPRRGWQENLFRQSPAKAGFAYNQVSMLVVPPPLGVFPVSRNIAMCLLGFWAHG